jgi:rubredoxin
MWLLFHRKAGTRAVAGGATFAEHCPTCDKKTRFEEVEVSESVGVFFVDVAGDKQRKYRCRVCQDVFDLVDVPDEQPAPAPVDRTEQLAAEQRRRDVAKAATAARIEDELAELKKKLGR